MVAYWWVRLPAWAERGETTKFCWSIPLEKCSPVFVMLVDLNAPALRVALVMRLVCTCWSLFARCCSLVDTN